MLRYFRALYPFVMITVPHHGRPRKRNKHDVCFPFTSPLKSQVQLIVSVEQPVCISGQNSRHRPCPWKERSYVKEVAHQVADPRLVWKCHTRASVAVQSAKAHVITSDQQNSLLGQHDRLTGNISKQPHLADKGDRGG